MMRLAIVLWVVGLVFFVPYGTYHLFFEATRDQYALLITLILFWIFGYWGVVGPLIATIKVRRVFNALGRAGSSAELERALKSGETEEAVIDLIAAENNIPRFLAKRVYRRVIERLAENAGARP